MDKSQISTCGHQIQDGHHLRMWPDSPLLTTSSPPLCSRSPDKFPWMPTALA